METPTWEQLTTAGADVRLARIAAITDDGTVRVALSDDCIVSADRLESVSIESVRRAHADQRRVMVFLDRQDETQPVILGVVADPFSTQAIVDGENFEIRGDQQVTLRCGKASITLTRAGKIMVRGTYLSSRSSGVNRVKGASVQIN
ncbi:MAG TPA: hypothetical protein VGB22_00740 [candidate division Zixibacteria bacterium]|jgi:hypothetical protein